MPCAHQFRGGGGAPTHPWDVPPLRAETLAGMFLLEYSNEGTQRAYRCNLKEWFAWCLGHHMDPLEAKRGHVSLFAREQEIGRAPATVNRKLTAMWSFYQWCVDEEHLDRNPVARVKRPIIPSVSSRAAHCLTGVELGRCIQVAEWEGGYGYALICLLAFNALRIGEVISSRVEDLGEEKHNVTLSIMGKGSKPAIVGLPMRTVWALKEAHQGRTTGPLVLSGTGGPLTRDSAGRTCHRIAKRAGIKGKNITPHVFRHSSITMALAEGIDPRRVQKNLARHAKMDTTELYAHDIITVDQSVSYLVAGAVSQRMW
jgi:integrase/recombinase XerD